MCIVFVAWRCWFTEWIVGLPCVLWCGLRCSWWCSTYRPPSSLCPASSPAAPCLSDTAEAADIQAIAMYGVSNGVWTKLSCEKLSPSFGTTPLGYWRRTPGGELVTTIAAMFQTVIYCLLLTVFRKHRFAPPPPPSHTTFMLSKTSNCAINIGG